MGGIVRHEDAVGPSYFLWCCGFSTVMSDTEKKKGAGGGGDLMVSIKYRSTYVSILRAFMRPPRSAVGTKLTCGNKTSSNKENDTVR